MAEKTITITKREDIEGSKGTYLKITDTEEHSHFIFDDLADKWDLCQEGSTVTLTKEKKGKYWNVLDIKAAKSTDAPEKPSKPAYGQDSPEKRRSIERQTAAQIAFEHGINEEDTLDKPTPWTVRQALIQAEQIYQWISEGKIPAPTSTPEKQPQQGDKGQGGSPQPESLLDQALKCKDGVELYNFAVKHGITIQKRDTLKLPRNPTESRMLKPPPR